MLTALQRKAAAVEYEKIAADILAVIEARCFDFERGMYREGEHFEQYSQHTQVWAVLTGLASGARAQEVLTHALEEADVVACSFVMQFYLFRALEKAGHVCAYPAALGKLEAPAGAALYHGAGKAGGAA